MRIKNCLNGNQYLLTPSNKWVRNFTISSVQHLDINNTIKPQDHFIFIKNEFENNLNRYAWIDSENIYFRKIVIVSDGYMFKEKHEILEKLQDVAIIAVNGSLKKWECKKNVSMYVANNPYEECMSYLPKRSNFLPRCVASCRTNSNFLKNYNGTKFKYHPVNESGYNGISSGDSFWRIDDYRNSVCAAIGLAYKFGVEKLMLFCCDDSFESERPVAVKLDNNLWTYPQQIIAHDLIEGNLYWLGKQQKDIIIGDYSSGPRYNSAAYIEEEDDVIKFFE